jgi:tetratricopeptide (TPR) repeat protein
MAPGPEALALLDDRAVEATRLFNEKKRAEAEALALKILDLAPQHRAALRVLFEIRKGENQPLAAEALARRLAALPAPSPAIQAAASLQLAQLIIGQGRHAQAEAAAAQAVIATPLDATAHHVLGVVLTETGRIRAGERHYRSAARLLGRDDGTVLANTAWNLKLQGRLDEAAALYERALALRPDNSRGVGGYAQVAMARGDAGKAIALLEAGMARWPADRALRLLQVMADLTLGHAAAVLARLGNATETLLPAELAARGQACAALNRPAEAVGNFALAKKLQRERFGQVYDPTALVERAARYKAYFTADRLLPMPRAAPKPGTSAPQPVFLLGFPRSGTSLLEQMLAQVPGFAAGDDFTPVEDLTALVPPGCSAAMRPTAGAEGPGYPEALDGTLIGDGLDLPARLRALQAENWAAAGLSAPGVRFITDRAPGNPWHLGLIKLLFPEAPVVHVIRHPLDLMLANLAQERRLEANCGVSMVALARHYDLIMSMIRHYRGQLTLRYLPVRYEQLVADPKGTLTHVLNFIGADAGLCPSEAVLRDNPAPALGRTPAHMVARAPLHGRARYRYLGYQAIMPGLFAEVQPILRPWIEELGYGGSA